MKKLLWLDDMRNPLDDGWIFHYAPSFIGSDKEDIIWVKNYYDFVDYIKVNGLPNMIAFDYDLGEDVAKKRVENGMSKRQARKLKRETINGHSCAKWLVKYCKEKELNLPMWTVQSSNPEGKIEITKLLKNWKV